MGSVDFGRRFTAVVIDAVLMIVGGSCLGSVLGRVLGSVGGAAVGSAVEESDVEAAVAAGGVLGALAGLVLGIFAAAAIFIIWEGLTGAAAGKRILGMQVKSEDGSTASIGQLLLRTTVKNVYVLVGLIAGLISVATGMDGIDTLAELVNGAIFVGYIYILPLRERLFTT